MRLLFAAITALRLALAHHTADHIYEVARLALKTDNEGFVLKLVKCHFSEVAKIR